MSVAPSIFINCITFFFIEGSSSEVNKKGKKGLMCYILIYIHCTVYTIALQLKYLICFTLFVFCVDIFKQLIHLLLYLCLFTFQRSGRN